jgi:hypothetical protein
MKPPPSFSGPNKIYLNVLDYDMQNTRPHANQLILFYVTHPPAPIYKYQFNSIHTYQKTLIAIATATNNQQLKP